MQNLETILDTKDLTDPPYILHIDKNVAMHRDSAIRAIQKNFGKLKELMPFYSKV